MAYPIQPGYMFKIQHKKVAAYHEMPVADVYKDYYGIGYLITGNRMMITPDRTLILCTDDITFVNKELIHRTASLDDSCYETIMIKFKEEAVEPLISVIGKPAFDDLFQRIQLHISKESKPKILNLFHMMVDEWNHYTQYSELVLQGLLNQIFISCLREHPHNNSLKNSNSQTTDVLTAAICYIESNFFHNPSLNEVADHVHISSSYLSRLFRVNLGSTFSRFLNIQKINHAQRLLLHTSNSIVDIAMECGFPNSNYFCDVFKLYTGLSPLKYRKKYMNQ